MSQTTQTRYVILTGPSYSGKTTAAAMLVTMLRSRDWNAVHESFDAPIRHYMASLLGRKPDDLDMDEPLPELLTKTPRDFLRLESAHLRFNYGPVAVGKLLLARVKRRLRVPEYVVVDDGASVLDCRVLGKYYLVQVVRSKVERVYPFVMPNACTCIYNDGTLEQLKKKVEELAREITKC